MEAVPFAMAALALGAFVLGALELSRVFVVAFFFAAVIALASHLATRVSLATFERWRSSWARCIAAVRSR
jgi:hypothetical protein